MNKISGDKKGKFLSSKQVDNSKEFLVMIYSLEIITKIGKHFPLILLSMVSLNAILAANDFLANSIEFGILNSLFALGGIFSLTQMLHKIKLNPINSNSNNIDIENSSKIVN